MGPAAVAGIAFLQSGFSNSGRRIWEYKQVHCGVPQFAVAGWVRGLVDGAEVTGLVDRAALINWGKPLPTLHQK